jgi:5-methylcytosine-specific restriction endonuclease McrA
MQCLRRANFRCEHVRSDTGFPCGLPANQADHIVPNFEGGGDELGNLQALCEYHHAEKSSGEGARAARRYRARRKENAFYDHPAFK